MINANFAEKEGTIIGSAEALPYIVREMRSVRERDTERQRQRERRKWLHLSRAEIGNEFFTFPCQTAMNFAPFLAKNFHLSIGEEFCTFLEKTNFSRLEGRWVHTFRCQKRCALQNSSRSSFCFCQMAWQGIEAPKQTIELLAAPSFFSSKKWIKLIPKFIGNRKRDSAWGCARRINTTSENLQIEKHKSVRWAKRTPSSFVLFDLQIFWGGVYPPSSTSRTISFSISNSFWY